MARRNAHPGCRQILKLLWTRLAAQDRRDIRTYIARHNPAAALALDLSISDSTARLTAHPALGREGRVAGTRERVIHPNYVVVYDLTADCVRVLRLLHARRQWPEDGS